MQMLVYIAFSIRSFFTRSFIMSSLEAEITHRATQVATPVYQFSDEQLDHVLAALPPLVADALPAWRRTHRKWVSKEIAAFRPTDEVQARLAAQIVVVRHIKGSMLGLAGCGSCSPQQERWLDRTEAVLLRTGELLQRTLRRRQKTPASSVGVQATESIALLVTDAPLRSEVIQRGTVDSSTGTAPRDVVGSRSLAMTRAGRGRQPAATGATS
jgi:hypothetical protein